MLSFGLFLQSHKQYLFLHLTKSRHWLNLSRATFCNKQNHTSALEFPLQQRQSNGRKYYLHHIKSSPCQRQIYSLSAAPTSGKHCHLKSSTYPSSTTSIPKNTKSSGYVTTTGQFCTAAKNGSNDKFITSEGKGKLPGNDDTEEQVPEWIHPGSRTDSILHKDPELKSLLSDMASDFGRDNSDTKKDHERSGEKESKDDIDKAEVVSDDYDMSIVYFEESKEGGFSIVEPDSEDRIGQEVEVVDKKEQSVDRKANGVLSVADVVEILREDNARDVCVIRVPKEKQYVDYFVVVTGKSTRHLKAMTSYLNKVYKQMKNEKDHFMKIEGKYAADWMCIDFGDIVVHFMLEETRELYELEMLWTLGPEFDDQYHRISQYQSTVFQPVEPTEEELREIEAEAAKWGGYSVVIENKEEGETQISGDKRI